LGFGQWLVLRRTHTASAWISANIIAFVAFVPLLFVPVLLGQLLGAAWFGVVTGMALVWCLRQRTHEAPKPGSRSRPWVWMALAAFATVAAIWLIPILSHPYMRAIFHETIGNNVEAYKLFYIAETPNGRERIASEMTPAEIAEAERLAKEWLAAHPQK
jgi:hypothetical protein